MKKAKGEYIAHLSDASRLPGTLPSSNEIAWPTVLGEGGRGGGCIGRFEGAAPAVFEHIGCGGSVSANEIKMHSRARLALYPTEG